MGLLGDLAGPIVGLGVAAVVFVGVALFGLLDLAGTLTAADVSLGAIVTTLVLYAFVLFVIAVVGLGFLVWGALRLADRAADSDLTEHESIQRLLETAERSSKLRTLGLAKKFD
jgi:hypothetical protein